MEFKQYLVIGALSVGMLTGCGSDSDDTAVVGASYSGSTKEGAITENSKNSFQNTGVELIKVFSADEALNEVPFPQQAVPMAVTASETGNANAQLDKVETIKALLLSINPTTNNLPTGFEATEVTESDCDGVTGSMSVKSVVPDEFAVGIEAVEPESSDYEMTFNVTFNNFCQVAGDDAPGTDGYIYNGSSKVRMYESYDSYEFNIAINNLNIQSIDGAESYTIDYLVNEYESSTQYGGTFSFTIVSGGQTFAMSNTYTCIEDEECTDITEILGLDGKTYRLDVEGDNYYSNSIAGKTYDHTYGSVFIQSDNFESCIDDEGGYQLEQGTFITLFQESTVLIDNVEHSVMLEITATDCGVYESEIVTVPVPM